MSQITVQALPPLSKGLIIQPLGPTHKTDVIELVATTFAKREPLTISQKRSKKDLYPIVTKITDYALELGLSNVVIDTDRDYKIVGACLNKLLYAELPSDITPAYYTHDLICQLRKKLNQWIQKNSLHYKKEEVLNISMVSVKDGYRGKQLFAHMLSHSLGQAKKRGVKLLIVEATNPGTSISLERYFGFKEIAAVYYAQFMPSDGSVNPFALIPKIFSKEKYECEKCQMMVKQLSLNEVRDTPL